MLPLNLVYVLAVVAAIIVIIGVVMQKLAIPTALVYLLLIFLSALAFTVLMRAV